MSDSIKETETVIEEVTEVQEVPVETQDKPEPGVVEEVAEEKPEETNAEIEALKAMVTQLTSQVAELTKPAEETIVEEVTETPEPQENPLVAEYATALDKVVAEKLSGIPENISNLMPEGLTAVAKLDWIEKAAKAVPVKEEPAEQPKTVIESIGRPTPVQTETTVDVDKLSAFQKMKMFFDGQADVK